MDRDWILIIALGIGWGCTFFFNEMLLRDMGPLSVSFARVSTVAIACWVFLIVTGRNGTVPLASLAPLAVMGALMFATPFAVFPVEQQYVATGLAGIINALTPVMVVVISHFWPGGEKATKLKVLGVISGFLGMIFLTLPALQADESSRLFGTLIILLAPIGYAFGLNWVRRFRDIDTAVMVTWSFTFATLLLLPLVAALEGVPASIQPGTWVSIFILGVVLTGVAFMAGFYILPRAGATKTSTVTFIAPVSALLIGWLVLDEALGPSHFLGMAAILLGLFLIDGRILKNAKAQLIG